MTDPKNHAARLREIAADLLGMDNGSPDAAHLLAGAEALEAQGEWRKFRHFGQNYMVPFERSKEWSDWCVNREPGEPSAIVPEWAVPVPDDVVITGWRR